MRKKQPDSGVRSSGSNYPSVVLEVGSSESLAQLYTDAQLWLECTDDVRFLPLFFILSSVCSGTACCPYFYWSSCCPQSHSPNHSSTMATYQPCLHSMPWFTCLATDCANCPKWQLDSEWNSHSNITCWYLRKPDSCCLCRPHTCGHEYSVAATEDY